MRVHRIALRSYRGVDACELSFAASGVTVVEGDNEVGKSSLAEALHLLVDCRDDSTRREVKAVRPRHRDAGAEVEAEISAGPHRFVYAKRWHRDRYTRLKVLAPVAEVLTGREAHDRVLQLLGETVDLELWRALSAPQGDALAQQPLRDHPSLVAALDAAAGGGLDTADHGDLLARAAAEAARWSTPTGRPRSALADLRRAAEDARARVTSCRRALDDLEADVRWCADLERSALDLEPKLAAASTAAEAAAEHLADVDRRCAAAEAVAAAARLAASEARVAAGAVAERAALVEAASAAGAAVAAAAARVTEAEAGVAGRARAVAEAVAVAASAEAALVAASADVDEAAGEHTRLRGAAALAEAEAALAAAEAHRRALDQATEALAANPSSPPALAALQAAHEDLLRAAAALSACQATVRVEALREVRIEVDGTARTVPHGTVEDHGVVADAVIEVPGAVRLTVTAGADAPSLHGALARATSVLDQRCAALGVADLAEAQELERQRCAVAAEAASARAALAATLGGASIADLAALVADAQLTLGDRAPGAPVPTAADVAHARARWDRARDHHRTVERAADRAAVDVTARHRAAEVAAAALDTVRRLHTAAEATSAAQALTLGEARRSRSDAELSAAAAAADERATLAAQAWEDEARVVAGLDRPGAAQAAQRAVTERDGVASALREVREDLAAIRSRLELQGEAGLHDRLAEAERAAAAADEELASVEARAAAAQLLLTTLTRHRDAAARAYGQPLREAIEALAALVFGAGVGVALDDELRVTALVRDGVPIPWPDLSVGAREQLAVLTRLAAATLVSTEGGVPVVFDDVLGFSDPGRLVQVAAAFEAAAARCQIIVLTCDPARHRHLARAVTHSLTAPRAVAPQREAG